VPEAEEKDAITIKGRQAYMQQNLLNAEFTFVEYLNAESANLHVIGVIKALTKVSRQAPGSFCCIYACHRLYFSR
jgi:hypothetical protein